MQQRRRRDTVLLLVTGVLAVGVFVGVIVSSQAFLPSPEEARPQILASIEGWDSHTGVVALGCARRADIEAVDCLLRDSAGNRGWGAIGIVDVKVGSYRPRKDERLQISGDFPIGPDGVHTTTLRVLGYDADAPPTVEVLVAVRSAMRASGRGGELVLPDCPRIPAGATARCTVTNPGVTVEITRIEGTQYRLRFTVPLPA